jgi:geranylgeranyl reductase family protein
MPVTHSPDIAVVGAGPAGAWTAYVLARAGARVTVVDGSHPREKPCGGGVTGRALAIVASAVPALRGSPVRAARFIDGATLESVSVRLGTGGLSADGAGGFDTNRSAAAHALTDALTCVSRADFDAALLDAACGAGATFVAGRLLRLDFRQNGVVLETTAGAIQAPFLIGADGANSLVRRRLAVPFRREDLSIATGYFARGTTSDEIVIEITESPPGYLWSFPRPDHLAIGICAQADGGVTAGSLRAHAAAWIGDRTLAPNARLEPYSWPIPSLTVQGLRRLQVAGPGWCLAGDAAGLVDPITREGIYFALLSGGWAADAALANDSSVYDARVRAVVLPELARAARIKTIFFRLAASGLLIRALRESAAVRAVMADLIAGRQGYRGLRWRLMKTLEWRLAWRALFEL